MIEAMHGMAPQLTEQNENARAKTVYCTKLAKEKGFAKAASPNQVTVRLLNLITSLLHKLYESPPGVSFLF